MSVNGALSRSHLEFNLEGPDEYQRCWSDPDLSPETWQDVKPAVLDAHYSTVRIKMISRDRWKQLPR